MHRKKLLGYEVCLLAGMKLPQTFIKDSNDINVIVETPKGSSVKYTFDPDTELFTISKVLPEGLVFPLHFGFIPNTKGEDGDPLDVLILLDETCYPGCHIVCKVLGVIEAEQTEENKTVRNDRIIAKAVVSKKYNAINAIEDLESSMVDQVTYFFMSYNKLSDKIFKPLQNSGPQNAITLIRQAMEPRGE